MKTITYIYIPHSRDTTTKATSPGHEFLYIAASRADRRNAPARRTAASRVERRTPADGSLTVNERGGRPSTAWILMFTILSANLVGRSAKDDTGHDTDTRLPGGQRVRERGISASKIHNRLITSLPNTGDDDVASVSIVLGCIARKRGIDAKSAVPPEEDAESMALRAGVKANVANMKKSLYALGVENGFEDGEAREAIVVRSQINGKGCTTPSCVKPRPQLQFARLRMGVKRA